MPIMCGLLHGGRYERVADNEEDEADASDSPLMVLEAIAMKYNSNYNDD